MSDETARGDDSPRNGEDEAAAACFLQDLIARGEVVPHGEDLTPGATHELDENGKPRRRRFSAY